MLLSPIIGSDTENMSLFSVRFPMCALFGFAQSHDIFHQLDMVCALEGFNTWVGHHAEGGYLGRLG